MRRFAKPLYGLTPVPRVRIPPSPPAFYTRINIGVFRGCRCVLISLAIEREHILWTWSILATVITTLCIPLWYFKAMIWNDTIKPRP